MADGISSGLAHGTNGSPQLTIENTEVRNIARQNEEKVSIQLTILLNANQMSKDYPLSESGYFGKKGKNCRVIESSDPIATSTDFYRKIGQGGKISNLPNGKGTKTVLADGTVVVHRIITSTKESPAVEISVSASQKIKNQKIHFISGG